MQISWTPPEPRPGLLGEWDKFVGPGQTPAELWLILAPALLAGLAAPLYALKSGLGWTSFQLVIAGLMALDLTGGVVTNATAAAKRWYHRPGQGWKQHMGFIAVHALHIALVAWLFRGGDWLYFGIYYACLLAASLVITRSPLYLQRPVALLLLVGVLLVNFYGFPPTLGLEWFVPIFFLKLLVSHLLKEAPYRPR
ncbi:MAG: hypothetical protein JW862_04045 [Anaerolineales bacterium]|nr:hypothetical protein [Anaerolineales bacterium]